MSVREQRFGSRSQRVTDDPTLEQGRAVVDDLLSRGQLDRIPANAELAHAYLAQADAHLRVSTSSVGIDPLGAFPTGL